MTTRQANIRNISFVDPKDEPFSLFAPESVFSEFGNVAILGSSVTGLVLSTLSFFIFFKTRTNSPLFRYLSAYSFSGLLTCLFNTLQFVDHVMIVSDTYYMMFLEAYVILPGILVSYQFGGLLDIFALLDRVSIFNKKAKQFLNRWPPKKTIFTLIVTSVAINSAWYIYFTTDHVVFVHENSNQTKWYLTTTGFGRTQAGILLATVISLIRDLIIVAVQVCLNVMSMKQLRRYVNKKSLRLTCIHGVASCPRRIDVKLGIMVILICCFSTVEHFIILAASFYMIESVYSFGSVLTIRLAFCLLSLKRVLDFVVFVIFNRVFRDHLRRFCIIKRKK